MDAQKATEDFMKVIEPFNEKRFTEILKNNFNSIEEVEEYVFYLDDCRIDLQTKYNSYIEDMLNSSTSFNINDNEDYRLCNKYYKIIDCCTAIWNELMV